MFGDKRVRIGISDITSGVPPRGIFATLDCSSPWVEPLDNEFLHGRQMQPHYLFRYVRISRQDRLRDSAMFGIALLRTLGAGRPRCVEPQAGVARNPAQQAVERGREFVT